MSEDDLSGLERAAIQAGPHNHPDGGRTTSVGLHGLEAWAERRANVLDVITELRTARAENERLRVELVRVRETCSALPDLRDVENTNLRVEVERLRGDAATYLAERAAREKAERDRDEARAERDAWKATAEQGQRNTDYYRGLVVRCGVAMGVPAYVQDDGGVTDSVLCAKVPELVETAERDLAAARELLREAVEAPLWSVPYDNDWRARVAAALKGGG